MDPKKFYDTVMPQKYGADYEASRWHENPLLQAQFEMMQNLMNRIVLPFMRTPARVLEVGPGPGTWTNMLQKKAPGASYTLVDISTVMLSQARANVQGSVEFIESDWTSFHPEGEYDFFFSSRALEYVEDKKKAIEVVMQSLKIGGRGVIITKTPKPFFDVLRGRKSSLHQGQITPESLASFIRTSGGKVHAVHLATATFPGFSHPILNRFVFFLCQNLPFVFPITLFSESYGIVFEK